MLAFFVATQAQYIQPDPAEGRIIVDMTPDMALLVADALDVVNPDDEDARLAARAMAETLRQKVRS